MDPLETVKIEKDTSFILMLAAHRKGHKVYYLADGGITLKEEKVFFDVTEVIPQRVAKTPFIRKSSTTLSQDNVHAVFVRLDPPFNEKYLMNTWLLDRLPGNIVVINNPSGIRTVNEKIWAAQFTSIIPKTIVGRNKAQLKAFLAKEKAVVAKPTNGYGGSGIFVIRMGDQNTNVILETLSQNWSREIILQKYIPQAKNGDKRILLLNGEPLGAVLRLHAKDDHRNNFFAGGKPMPTAITAQDQKIIKALKPHLQALGLYFVGIDIIGDYLIEVNVTSPTCLQEMNRLYKVRLENKVILFAEGLINRAQKGLS